MSDGTTEGDHARLVRSAIMSWRDGLVNLSRTNRLLNFRSVRTSSVPVLRPAPAEVVGSLGAGVVFSFRSPVIEMSKESETGTERTAPRRRLGVLHTSAVAKDLTGALRNLLRRSHQEYLDRGLRTLYLAVGTLEWTDDSGMEYASPLLLVPVELIPTGPRQLPHLRAADDDPIMNPALALKLAEMDIPLPGLPDLDALDPTTVLEEVRRAVASRRGWRVENNAVLSYFTFAKEAMYRDLLDNEDRIAAHPAVVALAAGGRGDEVGDFGFDGIQDRDIDELAPVDRTPLVLDADSSQRACIAAAVDGRSFVMDGPPGTGKSQTIANMIGALLHAGRTVLFVSEKAAALDVVRNRLADVGLDPFLLELHSSKATRKEVAAELGRSLSHQPVARAGMTAIDRDQLRRRQDELNRYAAAMNEPRAPLDMSLHDAIGQLSNMIDVASAPRTGRPVTDLDPALFGDIRRVARDLSRAWRPAVEGSSYIWRGVRQSHALTARLQAARRALDSLDEILRAHAMTAEAFAMTGLDRAERLAALLEHAEMRPSAVPERWLTDVPAPRVDAAADRVREQVEAVRDQRQRVEQSAGAAWDRVPPAADAAALDLRRIGNLEPAPLAVDRMAASDIDTALHRLRSDAAHLATFRAAIEDMAGLLRLPVPRTFDEADRLLSVASTADLADRPETTWLSSRGCLTAQSALDHLTATCAALDAAEAAARRYFDDTALQADAVGLEQRFRDQHTGIRKLGGAYRQDKATVAAFTREGVTPAEAHQHLGLVVHWQNTSAALHAATPAYGRDLRSWFRGRTTDRERAARAIERAFDIVAWYPDLDLRGVAMQVAQGVRPTPSFISAVRSADTAIGGLRVALQHVAEFGPRPQLLAGDIAGAVAWLDGQLAFLVPALPVVTGLDVATGRSWTVGDTRRLLHLRGAVDEAMAALDAEAPRHADMCGALFEGDRTDLDALRAAAAWARKLQEVAGGVLTTEQAAALAGSSGPASLRGALSEWRARRADVVEAFDLARHAELLEDLGDVHDARDLLVALEQDAGGQDEWRAHQRAVFELRRFGLTDAVDFCAREQMPAVDVPAVIEKAVLAEWVDHHLSTDAALQPVRAEDRDSTVGDFRDLDRQMISTAVGSIVEVCNQRRPRTLSGQAGVIVREAEKKRKHMPVRELVLRSRDVTQAIKPCFMMSPLAVSQYLPPDLTFDVVIFDEASQVAPMDAINCIYRGRALITAGDAKQLPPTSFFALAGDDGDEWDDESDDAQDFESILDLAKSSGAFRSLTLKWHYRSRHESLIAFSNSSFYGGELITFPGADHEGPDVGVELMHVPGVYRRGSTRDNLIEARTVAERVIHHYDTRPGKSVGVVTFSEAQASTIELAVEEARQNRPDLDDHFGESRLDGFFVKSLESVQGDERDVMIFSIGYGPDENRKITASFGPLNRAGGWRRLNVAITRARYRNEIVSSLTAGEVPGAAANEGVRHLRRYLDFAERGLPALALDTSTGGDAESPFEESVISTIRSWGYDVTPQVGAAGYRIDLAVHHPDKPGVYVLGVECDGAQYHSSRTARDRDRLRDQVLTGLGWTMHRIWGTAWYRDRHGAERRLIEAIESAVRAPVRGLLGGSSTAPVVGESAPVELEEIAFSEVPDWTEPYVMASIASRPHWCEPHEVAAEPAMRIAVQEIVEVEAPVHIEVVRQRLRQAWNIGQIGSRIRSRLDSAVRTSGVRREGEFLDTLDRLGARVRTPVDGCRRTVQEIHSAELELALVNLVRDARGITLDAATVSVARLYGWNRRGPDITRTLAATVEQLVAERRLGRVGDQLSVPE